MYIPSYAETNWDDDRLMHLPTKIKELTKKVSDLEWEGIDASKYVHELSKLKQYLEESTTEFYPLF